MAVLCKKLAQSQLTTTPTAIVTSATGVTTQISSIYLANTNTSAARNLTLLAHGSVLASNALIPKLEIAANGSQLIQLANSPIILEPEQSLYAYVDSGSAEVVATVYGVTEQ